MMALPEGAAAGGMAPAWFGYVDVADVDREVTAFEAAGGHVALPMLTIFPMSDASPWSQTPKGRWSTS